MVPPQRVRVLRCCRCRLFQAHQEKKGLKWTCKACGEKQSFLRTYGEGSGADCRRHVQKLNLLQGQISEMAFRSLEEPGNVDEEENVGPRQAEHESVQEKPQSSENRWLKYLEKDSKGLGMEGGVCFESPPSSRTEKPDPSFNTGLPKKRKWSQSTVQPPPSPDVQSLGDSEVTLEPQKDEAGLAGKVKEGGSHKDRGTGELSVPRVGPPRLAPQVRVTSSKWERFLLPPGNGPRADMEPSLALQRDPKHAGAALAEQGNLWVQTPREGHPSRPLGAPRLPWPAYTFTSGSQRPCVKPSGQPRDTGPLAKDSPLVTGGQEPPLVQLCDLFKTGEDFEDDL
ncbi:MRN complex-interacting protein isoform X1 [Mustela lutreola]|uniref:MRN complex-interacting protein isoform X1 n=1 Tax=Mustela lutreola TaxID=9666 RepID=UPI0027971D83|nr:MRN complex-interacting protein isoform X1 [Mustela lutreola]